MPASYIYINDSGANTWQVGIDADGILETTGVAAQSPPTLYLNDFEGPTTTWRLDVATDGVLSTTSQTFDPAKPDAILLAPPSGIACLLKVYANGGFLTMFMGQGYARKLARLARLNY